MPSSENHFSIEFPADRDYVPFVQEFFRDYLKNYDFSKEFSEYAMVESSSWFSSVISKDKFLHALPMISFVCRVSASILFIEIETTDKKEFATSLNPQSLEVKK
jgi:hypothetical protein